MLSSIFSIIFCVAISAADMGPTFEKDQDGSAIIDLPQKYWKNKTYGSLKIHLSKEVLQNLTGKSIFYDTFFSFSANIFINFSL